MRISPVARPRMRVDGRARDAVGVAKDVEVQWAKGKEKGGVDMVGGSFGGEG